jgi:hypothetical protein
MKRRTTWGLVVSTTVAAVMLGRIQLVAHSMTRKEPLYAGTFYYDLEGLGRSRGYFDPDILPYLQLVIVPSRVMKNGLLVRVEVWNHAHESQPVYPIDPATYFPEFRDAAGESLPGDLLPPALPVQRTVDEFPRISPGNCLSANYLFPTFYQRFKAAKGVECRVQIGCYYYLDSKHDRTAKFELSSGWVRVPPP